MVDFKNGITSLISC